MRILVLEDDSVLAMDMADAIIAAGHRLTGVVSDEHEAVRIATVERPDLVLADLDLAVGGSGAMVATITRNLFQTPCLFVSGNPDECRKNRAATGAIGCLKKPFSRADLHDALQIAEQIMRDSSHKAQPPEALELYAA